MFASHFFPHPTAHIPNANAKWDAGSTLYLRSQYSSDKKKTMAPRTFARQLEAMQIQQLSSQNLLS